MNICSLLDLKHAFLTYLAACWDRAHMAAGMCSAPEPLLVLVVPFSGILSLRLPIWHAWPVGEQGSVAWFCSGVVVSSAAILNFLAPFPTCLSPNLFGLYYLHTKLQHAPLLVIHFHRPGLLHNLFPGICLATHWTPQNSPAGLHRFATLFIQYIYFYFPEAAFRLLRIFSMVVKILLVVTFRPYIWQLLFAAAACANCLP